MGSVKWVGFKNPFTFFKGFSQSNDSTIGKIKHTIVFVGFDLYHILGFGFFEASYIFEFVFHFLNFNLTL